MLFQPPGGGESSLATKMKIESILASGFCSEIFPYQLYSVCSSACPKCITLGLRDAILFQSLSKMRLSS